MDEWPCDEDAPGNADATPHSVGMQAALQALRLRRWDYGTVHDTVRTASEP